MREWLRVCVCACMREYTHTVLRTVSLARTRVSMR